MIIQCFYTFFRAVVECPNVRESSQDPHERWRERAGQPYLDMYVRAVTRARANVERHVGAPCHGFTYRTEPENPFASRRGAFQLKSAGDMVVAERGQGPGSVQSFMPRGALDLPRPWPLPDEGLFAFLECGPVEPSKPIALPHVDPPRLDDVRIAERLAPYIAPGLPVPEMDVNNRTH